MVRKRLLMALGIAILLGPGLAQAQFGVPPPPGGDGDSSPPDGSGGSGSGGYNPIITCSFDPGMSLYAFLECLATGISAAPVTCDNPTSQGGGNNGTVGQNNGHDCPDGTNDASDFISWVSGDGLSVYVLKREPDSDGNDQPDRLLFREDDANLDRTYVAVDRPKRVGRIRLFTEQPMGGGEVIVVVDDIEIARVSTTQFRNSLDLNHEMKTQIEAHQYETVIDDGFLYVRGGETPETLEFRRMELHVLDPGLTITEVALVEPEDVDFGLPEPGRTGQGLN